ncbi:MFS transporter [Nakamurella sp. YIM 132087]|uniref:MFS transporter n=1 Tax=Nakamurella alba TaxID=2665158 RepID=A0A7K1FQ38_9ACTN|nr:MFS transporter [Nakamurella alba]MTD15363.1 MFS transporter [Nakamurella alba]
MTATFTARPAASPAAPPSPARHGAGFWLIAFAFLTAMAFSTVPAPLYTLYQARDGFSTFMVTVVFGVYAIGVLVSLLLAGHVSDTFGRRRILVAALLLELVAAALFLSDPTLPVLLAARLITGLGVGMISATATAHLAELHAAHRPGASRQRFELVSTAANIGGLGVGPLVAGALAQYVDGPLRTPYVVFAVLLVLAIVAVLLAPETVPADRERAPYRPQRVDLGTGGARSRMIAAGVAGAAAFAVFGLFTSVAPGFVGGTLHHSSRFLAGGLVFAVFGAAAIAQSLTGSLTLPRRTALGLWAIAVGIPTVLAGTYAADLTLFLVGGVIAGAGAGTLFKAAIGMVIATAVPEKRGSALAAVFVIAYAGLSLAALGIGVASLVVSSVAAMTVFAVVLLAVLGVVAVLLRSSHRQPVDA